MGVPAYLLDFRPVSRVGLEPATYGLKVSRSTWGAANFLTTRGLPTTLEPPKRHRFATVSATALPPFLIQQSSEGRKALRG